MWCELRENAATPSVTPCSCADLGDGRIEVTYPATTPVGLHAVVIGFVPSTSAEQPAEFVVGKLRLDAAIRFSDESLVTGPSALKVRPGVLFDILVFATDEAGRQTSKGGEQLRAQLSTGPAPVALEVYDNGGGSYRVNTAVQVSGEYRIAFSFNGLPVAGSPITLLAPRGSASPRGANGSVAQVRASSPRGRMSSPRAVGASPRSGSAPSPRARPSSNVRPMANPLPSSRLPPAGPAGGKPRGATPSYPGAVKVLSDANAN